MNIPLGFLAQQPFLNLNLSLNLPPPYSFINFTTRLSFPQLTLNNNRPEG